VRARSLWRKSTVKLSQVPISRLTGMWDLPDFQFPVSPFIRPNPRRELSLTKCDGRHMDVWLQSLRV